MSTGPRLCVACLVTDGDRVCLVFSPKRKGWELPGGGVDENEDPADASPREFEEETGLRGQFIGEPRVLLGKPVPGAPYRSIVLVYRGTATGEPKAGDDAAEARWFARDAIPWAELSPLVSADALREWAAEQGQPWARLKERLADRPELRDLVRETEARFLDMRHGYQRAQEGREAAEKANDGLRRLVEQAETLRAERDALQAAALKAAEQMGESSKQLAVLNACVDNMHAKLATASRNGSRLATDLEQERQARIAADARVTALSLDLLARERERDDLRARLTAFTAPVDVDAELNQRAQRMADCMLKSAQIVSGLPRDKQEQAMRGQAWVMLRGDVEREAELRRALKQREEDTTGALAILGRRVDELVRALSAAEKKTEDVRQFLGTELQKAAHTEIDLLGRLAAAESATQAWREIGPRLVQQIETHLHDSQFDRALWDELTSLVESREAFGVQPPQAPSAGGSFYVATTDHGARVVRHGWVMATCEAKERSANIADAREIAAALNGRPMDAEQTLARFVSGHVQQLRGGSWEWCADGGFDQGVIRLAPDVCAFLTKVAESGALGRAVKAADVERWKTVAERVIAEHAAASIGKTCERYGCEDAPGSGEPRPAVARVDGVHFCDRHAPLESDYGMARAVLRLARGDYAPASAPSRMAQAACAAFVESDAAATAEEIAQAARASLSGCETVTTWAEQLARRQAADEPAAEMAVTTGLDVASVGDAEGVAALVGLDAPADTVGDEP